MISTNITQATSLPLRCKYNAVKHLKLHPKFSVFADASPKAYGAAAYIQQDQNPASLVMSKSKTASPKQLTLPQLAIQNLKQLYLQQH